MALSDDLSLKDILDILKFIPYNYVIPYNSLECHVTYSYVYINNVCVYIYVYINIYTVYKYEFQMSGCCLDIMYLDRMYSDVMYVYVLG